MKIISRYILKEALVYFTISLLIFTGILFTLRVLKLTSLIINKGVALSQVISVFISIIPTFLEIAVPLASLLGIMLTFARLSGDSEIIVMRASGISLSQLIRPVFIFGLLTMTLGLYVSHQLKPWGFQKLSATLFEIARTKSTAGLEPGVFNKLGNITLYAETVDNRSGKLTDVIIEDRTAEDAGQRVISALRGTIIPDPKQQTIVFHLEQGEIHESDGEEYQLTRYVSNDLVIDANALYGEKEQRLRRTRELTWTELTKEEIAVNDLLKQQKIILDPKKLPIFDKGFLEMDEEELRMELQTRKRKLRFEKQLRFSLPIASLLLALVGLTLGIQSPRSQRTWGAGLSALIGLLVFLGYFAIFSLGKTLGEEDALPPVIAAWLPNVLLLTFSCYLLRQMATERWQNISEGVERGLARIKELTSVRRRLRA